MKKLLFLSMLVATALLTGCAGALVGDGGNTAESHANKDQRSIEQINKDARVTSDIKARYANDVVLNKLTIITYRGVVTLYGSVPTRSVMDRAVGLARSVQGVTRVESRLRLR